MKKLTYENWYSMYSEEIDTIVDLYVKCVMNKFSSTIGLSHSLNINMFSEKLKKLIYKKSLSNTKDSIAYL